MCCVSSLVPWAGSHSLHCFQAFAPIRFCSRAVPGRGRVRRKHRLWVSWSYKVWLFEGSQLLGLVTFKREQASGMPCLHDVLKTTQALKPLIALFWHTYLLCMWPHSFLHMWPHLALQLLCSSWVSGGAFSISKLSLIGFSTLEPAISGTVDLWTALRGFPVSPNSGSSYLPIGVIQP